MTNRELLELRNVILVIKDIEEAKRVTVLLWRELKNDSWSKEELDSLSEAILGYKKNGDEFAIHIDIDGKCGWCNFKFYTKEYYYSNYKVMYIQSKKEMETREVKITIEQAREWYHCSNIALRTLALSAYKKNELVDEDYAAIRQSMYSIRTLSLAVPTEMTDSVECNAKLAIMAAYFNGDWKMKAGKAGYFISNKSKGFDSGIFIKGTVGIGCHISVQYAGIIYFKNQADAIKAAKLLEDDLCKLF